MSAQMAAVSDVLATYLAAGEDAVRLRGEADRAEERQGEALAKLAGMLGRTMAAQMAGVEESAVRSAIARRSAPDAGLDDLGGLDGDGLPPKR
ncbi:MAG: hypothetical protein ACRDYC_01100 [Acidimicrobiales bacterium]